jgi:hypothetical protein
LYNNATIVAYWRWQVARPKKTKRKAEQPEPEPAYPSDHERVKAVLKESGMLMELGPEWDKYVQEPVPTLEEVRKMLADQPPISEDIIEMRGEL